MTSRLQGEAAVRDPRRLYRRRRATSAVPEAAAGERFVIASTNNRAVAETSRIDADPSFCQSRSCYGQTGRRGRLFLRSAFGKYSLKASE